MIDVFICTYNPNPTYLLRTVNSILAQNMPITEWGLTIIDNNSVTPVSELEGLKKLNINVVVEKKQGLTAARGCAQSISKADILIFVDDDNILDNNYLQEVKTAFDSDHKIGILSGRVLPEYEEMPQPWFYEFENMLAIRKLPNINGIVKASGTAYSDEFPIGAGMSVKASVISGYYNSHINSENYIDGRKGDELMSSEDLDLDFYALSTGFDIGVNSKMRLMHIIPTSRTTLKYLTKLAVGNVKSGILVNAKWAPVFKQQLFSFAKLSIAGILLRYAAFKLLSFKKGNIIKYNIFKELLNIRLSKKVESF